MFILLVLIIVVITMFSVFMIRKGNIRLIHWLYFVITGTSLFSLPFLAVLTFLEDDRTFGYVVDAVTNTGLFIPVLLLLVSLTFTRGWEKLPKWCWALFIVPLVAFVLVWTNPLHRLYYKNEVFSINREEVTLGPLAFVSGVYAYICFMLSVWALLSFSLRGKNVAFRKQAVLFAVGNFVPMVASVLGTFQLISVSIYTTPLSYSFGVLIFHGLAIFRFNMLDIRPLAVETILNRISDCYMVVNEKGVIVSHNKSFADTFGIAYELKMHSNIYDCAAQSDLNADVGIHTLLASISSCKESETTISYEQSLTLRTDGAITVRYYMVDITGLVINGKNVGFVVFFKDISKLKESDRDLHNSQIKLMEREQLAFLGQMIGGISHNLKTPIMSISGSCNAVINLVNEATSSLDDPDVGREDYTQMYSEMRQWVSRIHEACSYMSDIITAVKGQATSFNTNNEIEFTMDDVIKRVNLLLRHELLTNCCSLKFSNLTEQNIHIYGDINSIVQVVNNLVSNAIYAMKDTGGEIGIEADADGGSFLIRVRDRGAGIPEDVKKHLFQQMVTSKGAGGSGLGLFMSKSLIKTRFDGTVWFEDNPGGGTVFVISVPRSKVEIGDITEEGK